MSSIPPVRLVLPAELSGLRLDQALPRLLPGLSRVAARQLCARRAVRRDEGGGALAAGARAVAGWRLTVALEQLDGRSADELVALRVRVAAVSVREVARRWAAVSKPSGLGVGPAHFGDRLHFGWVARRLLTDVWSGVDPSLPDEGLVHRLDHATSGISVMARDARTLAILCRQRDEGRLTRRYWALVEAPVPPQGEIAAPIAHHPQDQARMVVAVGQTPRRGAPRAARTTFVCSHAEAGVALLEVSIHGGRRHQIRVHLAHVGLPILGDLLYGGRAEERLGLHASSVDLTDPDSGAPCRVVDPPGADFAALCDWSLPIAT